MKKLFIKGIPAVEGMEVITGKGEKGILTDWKEPHKIGSTGRVYVKFEGRSRTDEYFPGVIGGVWREDIQDLYDVIGKEFEDFDFTINPLHCKPPFGWSVKTVQSTEIEYLEIKLPEDMDEENIPDFKEINKFTYEKVSKVVTNYIFTRKK